MPATPSTMLELGTACPDFRLPDTDGKPVTRDGAKGPHGLLVMFICNHCPFVVHVQAELAKIGRLCAEKGVGVVAVSSNDITTHPDDSPAKMKQVRERAGYTFPYLYDETQAVARQFTAACTPDFFLFDKSLRLAYRGQLDDSRPGNAVPVTGRHLRAAIDSVAQGKPVKVEQLPSIGCNIKWKKGAAPAYAGAI